MGEKKRKSRISLQHVEPKSCTSHRLRTVEKRNKRIHGERTYLEDLRSTKTAIASGNSALLYCSNFCMVCSIRQNVKFHSSQSAVDFHRNEAENLKTSSPHSGSWPGIRTTGNSPIECGATPSAVASVDVEKVRVPFIMNTVDYLPTIAGFWQPCKRYVLKDV